MTFQKPGEPQIQGKFGRNLHSETLLREINGPRRFTARYSIIVLGHVSIDQNDRFNSKQAIQIVTITI